MPHVLWELQGQRAAKYVEEKDPHDPKQDGAPLRRLRAAHAGQADAARVRRARWPTWSPSCSGWASRRRAQRVRLGVWVLIFLAVFTRDRLAPERRVLERREVTVSRACGPDRAAGRCAVVLPDRGAHCACVFRLASRSHRHDGALFRNHLPLLAPLPLRAVREGHGLRDPRRRPVRQARRHRADEPVQRGADPGRARPDPVRVAHHQRVHRRALPAPAADAGRPGGARARAPVPVQLREGTVRATSTSSSRAASSPPTSSSRRRARRSATA